MKRWLDETSSLVELFIIVMVVTAVVIVGFTVFSAIRIR